MLGNFCNAIQTFHRLQCETLPIDSELFPFPAKKLSDDEVLKQIMEYKIDQERERMKQEEAALGLHEGTCIQVFLFYFQPTHADAMVNNQALVSKNCFCIFQA